MPSPCPISPPVCRPSPALRSLRTPQLRDCQLRWQPRSAWHGSSRPVHTPIRHSRSRYAAAYPRLPAPSPRHRASHKQHAPTTHPSMRMLAFASPPRLIAGAFFVSHKILDQARAARVPQKTRPHPHPSAPAGAQMRPTLLGGSKVRRPLITACIPLKYGNPVHPRCGAHRRR